MRQPRGKLAQTRANSWTPPKLVTPSTKRRHMPRPSHHGRATAGRQRAAAMPRASTGQQDRRAAGRRPTRVTKALLGTPRASAEEPRAAAMHQDRPVQAPPAEQARVHARVRASRHWAPHAAPWHHTLVLVGYSPLLRVQYIRTWQRGGVHLSCVSTKSQFCTERTKTSLLNPYHSGSRG